MIVRFTEACDLPAIAEIERVCFSAPWSEEALRSEFSNDSLMLTAEEDGRVCGYMSARIVLDECYINNIAVAPGFRRRGVASAVLAAAEAECRRKACAFISLEVRASNVAAIALYEKRGYSLCGNRKNFYTLPREDGLIYTLTLT